jgi:hypothetical protein
MTGDEVKDKRQLKLYTDYLIDNCGYATATGLSTMVNGAVNHARSRQLGTVANQQEMRRGLANTNKKAMSYKNGQ